MTVGELTALLSYYDQTLEVGGSGHFGELLEIYSLDIRRENSYRADDPEKNLIYPDGWVYISMESAGDEPS